MDVIHDLTHSARQWWDSSSCCSCGGGEVVAPPQPVLTRSQLSNTAERPMSLQQKPLAVVADVQHMTAALVPGLVERTELMDLQYRRHHENLVKIAQDLEVEGEQRSAQLHYVHTVQSQMAQELAADVQQTWGAVQLDVARRRAEADALASQIEKDMQNCEVQAQQIREEMLRAERAMSEAPDAGENQLQALEREVIELESKLLSERIDTAKCSQLVAERKRQLQSRKRRFEKEKRAWEQELSMELRDRASMDHQVQEGLEKIAKLKSLNANEKR